MAALVLAEPDMGTACMIFMIAFVMLYVSGLSLRYIFATGLAAIPAIYLLIVRVPYRYERAKSFFSPGADPQGHGFQLLQSLIAIGSGGFSGSGADGKPAKAFLSAGGAHGLHLRHHLRGARVHWSGYRAFAVRSVRLAGIRGGDESA